MKIILWPLRPFIWYFKRLFNYIHYGLPIEASRYSAERLKFYRWGFFVGSILVLMFALNIFMTINSGENDRVFGSFMMVVFGFVVFFISFVVEKGYRNRANVSDEQYQEYMKTHTVMSDNYLFYSVAIGTTITILNKYYLHWF